MLIKITLTIIEGALKGQEFIFDSRTTCIVGRSPDCNPKLPDDEAHNTISRYHCLLDINPPDIRVRDFGSRNGTFVNGAKIGQREADQTPEEGAKLTFPEYDLKTNDEIKLGDTVFRVSIEGVSEVPPTQPAFNMNLRYSNPWILKRVTRMVHTVHAGDVSDFVENTSVFVDNVITDFLDNQFKHLSELEKNVIYWIAIRRNTASWNQLVEDKGQFLTYEQLFYTVDYLIQGRLLVNKNVEEVPIIFTLDPVILKYTTNRFVEEVFRQISQTIKTQAIQGSELFISHSFVTANADELTEQQVRRIVKVVKDKLLFKLGSQHVDNELRKILCLVEDEGQGYGRRNISHLLL